MNTIGIGEKILVTLYLVVPMLLVILTKGRDKDTTGTTRGLFLYPIDWKFIRQIFFRDDGRWRPISKGLLLFAFAVALIFVWIA